MTDTGAMLPCFLKPQTSNMEKYNIIHHRGIAIVLLLLCHLNLSAQYANFQYNTELCDCTALFDSTKYTRQQLQNTFEYLYSRQAIYVNFYALDRDKEPKELLDLLKKEYKQKIDILEHYEFVNVPFWQEQRKEMIRHINNYYELSRVTIQARINPSVLFNYKLVDNDCKFYRNALVAGGRQLLKAWSILNERQKKKNGSPENLQLIYEERYNSPNRMKYAREEVMTYGWWNSANALLPDVSYEGIEKNFNKLLKNINCDCDEP